MNNINHCAARGNFYAKQTTVQIKLFSLKLIFFFIFIAGIYASSGRAPIKYSWEECESFAENSNASTLRFRLACSFDHVCMIVLA